MSKRGHIYLVVLLMLVLFVSLAACSGDAEMKEYHVTSPTVSLLSEVVSIAAFTYIADGKLSSYAVIASIFVLLLVIGQFNLFYILSFMNWLLFYAIVDLPCVARHCPPDYRKPRWYDALLFKRKGSNKASKKASSKVTDTGLDMVTDTGLDMVTDPGLDKMTDTGLDKKSSKVSSRVLREPLWSYRSDHVLVWAIVSVTLHTVALSYYYYYHDVTPIVSTVSFYRPLIVVMESGRMKSNTEASMVTSVLGTSYVLTLALGLLAALFYSCRDFNSRDSRDSR